MGWPGKASRSADHEVVCGTAFQQKRWGRCLLGGLGEGQEFFGARARKPGGKGLRSGRELLGGGFVDHVGPGRPWSVCWFLLRSRGPYGVLSSVTLKGHTCSHVPKSL